ncbi:MAG: BolA family transcriptional regulator [Candidatus Omnitrophica bacterium]|nr:BolA family transcriptional regulator [Candidatus Omnitrophota bacterium]
MQISNQEIEAIVRKRLPNSEVLVQDMTGTGDHFQLVVMDPSFEGMSLVGQHRLVMGALSEQLEEAVHAVQIKTLTPRKWQEYQNGGTNVRIS